MTSLAPAAVLFDYDATLADTEPCWFASEAEVVARHGKVWTTEDAVGNVGGDLADCARKMLAHIGDDSLELESFMDEWLEIFVTKAIARGLDLVKPGGAELVAELRERGTRVALVSSTYRHLLERQLVNLPYTFDVIVGGDEVSHTKPHPEPYLKAAELLGVDIEQCLVVEDSITGSRSAQAAGAAVIVVPDTVRVPAERGRTVWHTLEGRTAADLDAVFAEQKTPVADFSGVRQGPLREGERVTLTDPKGRRHSVVLKAGKGFHTTKGGFQHDELIGQPEGITATTKQGLTFLVMRPLMNEFMVSMPREAAVIYPKDAAQILMWADIFPGARVLEAGVGSGALSIAMLRAIGPDGRLDSYERRPEFAAVARRNVETFVGGPHPAWTLRTGDLVETITDEPIDRAVLDMLAPWECVDAVGERLVPGGVLCCYVATTTQMGRVMDTLRVHGGWTEPVGTETTIRDWHAEGLAIRPGHGSTGHTGFLVMARRLAPGVTAPMRKRRPAPGAYGKDYHGPRPKNVPMENQDLPEELTEQ